MVSCKIVSTIANRVNSKLEVHWVIKQVSRKRLKPLKFKVFVFSWCLKFSNLKNSCKIKFLFFCPLKFFLLNYQREAAKYKRQMQLKIKELREEKQKFEENYRAQEREKKIREWIRRKDKENNRKTHNVEKDIEALPDPVEIESNFQAWLTKKMQLQEEKKLKVIQQEKTEKENRQIMRCKSAQKYNEWLKTVHTKSKPVPLNQGFLSTKN